MLIKTNDGTQLNVNKIGQGPVLILVAGANGTGDIFNQATQTLKTHFTVITYDRRGYGQTVLAAALPVEAQNANSHYRIDADVADIFTLANTFCPHQPVYLMGSSSGSIVAAKAFADNPQRFAKVAIHECPLTTVIADDGKFQAKTAALVQTALQGDFSALTELFKQMKIQPLDAQMMGLAADSKPDPQKMQSMLFWLQYESAQYPCQVINWQPFIDNHNHVVLLNGTDSTGFYPQKVTQAISDKIGVRITMTPGGHLGYAQKPHEFADTLAKSLLSE